jgi:hypothetical protein
MRLALIPPYQLADDMWQYSDITLGLAYILESQHFEHPYIKAWQLSGYKILDNGAAEGSLIGDIRFMEVARNSHPDEIVVPDVLGRPEQTIARADAFFEKFPEPGYKLMYALQGIDIKEAVAHLRVVMGKPWWPQITCLGLPRLLITQNHRDVRIDMAKIIHEEPFARDRDIHFLGASSKWPAELREAAREVPFVRSMDTSMPYVYGLDGRLVDEGDIINRPTNYFSYKLMPEQRDYVFRNVNMMLEWTKGE